VIAETIQSKRWFRGKARKVEEAEVDETYPLDLAGTPAALLIVRVRYAEGADERYVLVGFEDGTTMHYDALSDPKLLSALLEKLRGGGTRIDGAKGRLVFRPLPKFDEVLANAKSLEPKPSAKEQTNTSIPFGDAFILKIVRVVDDGRSAELEMGEYLTKSGYTSTPPVLGAIELERERAAAKEGREPSTIGIVHAFSPNRGEAWSFTLDVLAKSKDPKAFAEHAKLLAKRVREMHEVLGRETTNAAFSPEPIERERRQALADALEATVAEVKSHLREGDEAKIDAKARTFVDRKDDPIATRIHGDLHLGQILVREDTDDFVIIDFEGEPARSLAERKSKRSPMADVAGMLRSFDYATATAKAGRDWYTAVSAAFLGAYGDVPRDVLDFYLLEKCIYEIKYEANNRPDWIKIPLEGLRELLG
jgi:trehalose synthase-fused probable maltokinase